MNPGITLANALLRKTGELRVTGDAAEENGEKRGALLIIRLETRMAEAEG
jgi:hypothetical protein